MNKKSYLSLALVTLISTSGMQAGFFDTALDALAHPSRTATQTSVMDVWRLLTNANFQNTAEAAVKKVPVVGQPVVNLAGNVGRYGHALVTLLTTAAAVRLAYLNKDKVTNNVVKPAKKHVKRFLALS